MLKKKLFIPLLVGLLTLGVSCAKINTYLSEKEPAYYEFNAWADLKYNSATEATVYINNISGLKTFHALEQINDKGIKILNLVVLSGGGSILDMWSIVDQLERFKSNGGVIKSHATGIVASAAVPIYLMGQYRTADKNVVFMLHPHSLWGKHLSDFTYNPDDDNTTTEKTLFQEMSELWTKKYAEILYENTFMTYEDAYAKLTTGNINTGQWWIDCETAYELGFMDEILY